MGNKILGAEQLTSIKIKVGHSYSSIQTEDEAFDIALITKQDESEYDKGVYFVMPN